jgi:hypothetical protein
MYPYFLELLPKKITSIVLVIFGIAILFFIPLSYEAARIPAAVITFILAAIFWFEGR